MVREEVERLCRKFRCTGLAGLTAPCSAPEARCRRRFGLRAARGPGRDGSPRGTRLRPGRRPAGGGRHGNRQDARVPGARDPEPAARARLDRHQDLQEQIYFKDIPTLRQALDVPFTATYMKGRSNYLCLHRLDQLNDGHGPMAHDVFLPIVREWRADRHRRSCELEDLPEDLPFWSEVAATAETCIGTECPRYDECFVTRMRQRAAASDVVIVNHHLLCADAAVRQNAYGEVIPSCSHAIVDEAHQLEDIATQYFGVSFSNYRTEDYARDVERFVRSGASRAGTARPRSRRASIDCATTPAPSSPNWRSRTAAANASAERSACGPPTLARTHARSRRIPRGIPRSDRSCARAPEAGAAQTENRRRPSTARRSPGGRRNCATNSGSCCAPAIRRTCISWSSGQGRLPSRSPIDVSTSSAACCSIGCVRRCSRPPR